MNDFLEQMDKLLIRSGSISRKVILYLLVILALGVVARFAARPITRGRLLAASARGDIGRVRILLVLGADINGEDRKGGTPLFLAALNGQKEITEFLRGRGGDTSERCSYGTTPEERKSKPAARLMGEPQTFIEYCMAGDLEQVRRMLRLNSKLATMWDDSDRKPIAYAVEFGQVEIVKVLLEYGASPVDGGEDTMPIEAAEFHGNREIANLLRRNRGAFHDFCAIGDVARVGKMLKRDPELLNTPSDTENGRTPLEMAITHRQIAVARLLVRKGANVNKRGIITPLERAADSGVTEMVALLLAYEADPNLKSDGGDRPLKWAKTREITALLVAKGADVNTKDSQGQTPLFHAHDRRQAELLVAFGANPKARAGDGSTPLFAAFPSAVRYLVSVGVDVNAKDVQGETALHWAAFTGMLDKACELVRCGADVNAWGDEETGTPLHQAASRHQKQMIEFLLDHGADVNAGYPYGGTPLHWAVGEALTDSDYDAVRLLIKKGARLDAKAEGKTPLDLAQEHGMTDVVKLLRQYGAR